MIAPFVSDHAVLRWLQRVDGLDLDAVRARIAKAAQVGLDHGAQSVIVGRGKLVLRGEAVVTVLERHAIRHDLVPMVEIEVCGEPVALFDTQRRGR